MQTTSLAYCDGLSTAPYFESVARSFYSQFGDDALRLVDMAIERLECDGPDFALEMWHEIRLTLLRKAPASYSVTIQ